MSTSTCSSPTNLQPSSGEYFSIPNSTSPNLSNSSKLRNSTSRNKRSFLNLVTDLEQEPTGSTSPRSTEQTSCHEVTQLYHALSIPDGRITKPTTTSNKQFVLKPPPIIIKPVSPTVSSFSTACPNLPHGSPKFISAHDLPNITEIQRLTQLKGMIHELDEQTQDILIIDLRSFNQYNTSRLRESLNICVPSTLLKRTSFKLSNILKTMISVQERYMHSVLTNEKKSVKFIFYDVNSTLDQCSFHTYQILKKFASEVFDEYPNKNIELFLYARGFTDLVYEDTENTLIDSKKYKQATVTGVSSSWTESKNNSAISLKRSPSLAENMSKFTLPSATDPSFSFINSLKKNQIQLDNPEELLSQYSFHPPNNKVENLPNWLKPYLEKKKGLKRIIENFQKIEVSENERIFYSVKTRQMSNNSPQMISNRLNNANSPIDYILNGTEKGFKNRYPNILPYEHSRVRLVPSPITPNPNDNTPSTTNLNDNYFGNNWLSASSHDDYINANFITVPQINPDLNYIATQAPLPSTIKDFWKVCFHNDVSLIISLTNLTEFGIKKSDIYWENSQNVELLEEIPNFNGLKDTLIYRKLKITNRKGVSKLIHQLQFLKWPDSGVVDQKDLLQLIKTKEQFINKSSGTINEQSPILVHCSAGCGRTGVFITIDLLYKTFQKLMNSSNVDDLKSSTFWTTNNDIINFIVEQLRKQRISMVQNLEQFIFCYETLLNYFEKLNL